MRLLNQGRIAEALERWFQALEGDPENWIVRKQVWQVLYPERFDPTVDYAWQREHRAKEDAEGIRAANPISSTLNRS